ncbi:MAG: hypothetical protein U1E65_05700 [Myxococcota bacterium]
MAHRVTLKQKDGRVQHGYTPAFDPKDGSLWLSPEPNSPAGIMIPIDRIAFVLLEPTDARPVELVDASEPADKSMGIRISFSDGEVLTGRTKAQVAGKGIWIQPSGKSFARAFVPDGVSVSMELDESGDFQTDGAMLSFALPSLTPPEQSFEHSQTDEMPALPYGLARDSIQPTQSLPAVTPPAREPSDHRDTMPVEVPTLDPPPLPDSGRTALPAPSTSSQQTLALPLVELSRTEKDTIPPES